MFKIEDFFKKKNERTLIFFFFFFQEFPCLQGFVFCFRRDSWTRVLLLVSSDPSLYIVWLWLGQ